MHNNDCNAEFSTFTQDSSQLMHSLCWVSNPSSFIKYCLGIIEQLYRDIPLCSSIRATVNTL